MKTTEIKYQARVKTGSEIITLTEANTPFELICDLCESGLSHKDFAESDITIHRVIRDIYKFQGEIAYVTEMSNKNPAKLSEYAEIFNNITYIGY